MGCVLYTKISGKNLNPEEAVVSGFVTVEIVSFVLNELVMAVHDFAFTDGTSGKIAFNGLVYTATTGFANCLVNVNLLSGAVTNGFFQFDTGAFFSSLSILSIDAVEFFYVEALAQPSTPPDIMEVYIGDFIGAALNGNAGEFNGGTFMLDAVVYGWLGNSNAFYNLADDGADPTPFINLTGTTDIRFKHDTTAGSNGRAFNTTKGKCLLRVTYTLASRIRDVVTFVGVVPFKR